jgi:general secretion pathway protein E/type IV pilus assembly protein PilB
LRKSRNWESRKQKSAVCAEKLAGAAGSEYKSNQVMSENVVQDSKSLLDKMVAAKQLSAIDAEALARQTQSGAPQPPDEEGVLRWLAQEYDLAFTSLEDVEPDRQLLSLFPARILLKEELLPLRRINGVVEVATSRLFATQGLDALKSMTGLNLKPVLATSEAIQREMKKRLGVGADTIDTLGEEGSFQVVDEAPGEDTDLDSAAEDASIIRFVNQVLRDAIELRSSDIHLEPFEDEFRIRYRIDGVLQEVPVPAQLKRFQPAIVSRVKILSHLNIAEKRLPQDGRIKIRIDEAEVDIRVSVIPMLHGEAVVMRLLRQNATLRGMEELDMAPRELDCFRRVLQLPHGIILVTGPTGSGKTSTLYTALNEINDADRKIITIEDPVEYQLKGVNQIQVSEKAGLTFARGLRSILRHDPDVVLIGEIRDQETAQIAVQASLTGHLVFSTLHTNDAPGALTRLVDMGVEPYLVASSLEAVLAQRLVRVLCGRCKQEDRSPTAQTFKEKIGIAANTPIYRSVGCEECRQTGFYGRHAIFEWMDSTLEIRQLILKNVSSDVLSDTARRSGMRTLAEDGWRLVNLGITTVEEVLSVTTAKEVESATKITPPPDGHPREAHLSPVLAPGRRPDGAA